MTIKNKDLTKSTVAGIGGAHIGYSMFGARGPLLEGADGGTTSVTAAPTPTVIAPSSPVPSPVPPPPAPAGRSFSDADLDRVRQEEKAKLYSEMNALKEQNRTLQAQVRQSQPPEAQSAQEMQAMREAMEASQRSLETLQQQINMLTTANQQEQSRRRQVELQLFLNQRVKAYQDAGHGLIMEMIRGANEQEIEQSIQQAAMAYQHYFGQVQPTAGVPVAVQVQAAPVSTGFPSVPNPQAVVQNNPSQLGWFEQTKQLTTEEAVRSGEYAKNRQTIMSSLQNAGGGVAGTLANTPRFSPTPGAIPQSTWQGVTQPQARMAPPPMPTHLPQGQQQPQFMQPQQPQFQPQLQQQMVPLNGGFDPNAARATAAETAQRHLANPGSVSHDPKALAQVPRHAEYGAPRPQQVQFNGVHPMQRNTEN